MIIMTESTELQQQLIRSREYLPAGYIPRPNDVVCENKIRSRIHNKRFHATIKLHLKRYIEASDKNDVIDKLIDSIRQESIGGGFIKLDRKIGLYYEVGDFHARQKVVQAFTDILRRKNNLKFLNDESNSSDGNSQSSPLLEPELPMPTPLTFTSSSLHSSLIELDMPVPAPMALTRSPTSSPFNRISAPPLPPNLNRNKNLSISSKFSNGFTKQDMSSSIQPPSSLRSTPSIQSMPSLNPLTSWSHQPNGLIRSNNGSSNMESSNNNSNLDNNSDKFNPTNFHMKKCTLDLLESDDEGDLDCNNHLQNFFNLSRRKSNLPAVSE